MLIGVIACQLVVTEFKAAAVMARVKEQISTIFLTLPFPLRVLRGGVGVVAGA